MAWSRFWIERAQRAVERRGRAYGLEPPPAVSRALERERLGFAGSLRLILYVVVGSPWQRLRLLWLHLTDRDTPRRVRLLAGLAAELRPLLSAEARVLTGRFERGIYSRDLARVPGTLRGLLQRTTPLVVAQARTEEDVAAVMRFAAARRLPLYPRGVSSSAFGGAVPTRSGVVLDLSLLDEIAAVDAGAHTCRVQPGVRWGDLAARLARDGLAPRTTPSSRFSTVGGWAATGGLGLEGYRYGHFREAIVGARVVVPDGRVLALAGGDPALRDFVGTEGQLGVFTELTLKLRPAPGAGEPVLVYCDDLAQALERAGAVAATGCDPTHVAVLDAARLREENELQRDRTGRVEPVVEERDAVLLQFDDAAAAARFRAAGLGGPEACAPPLAARYLWSERFFPLKAQRLGPGLLACEVVLPLPRALPFIRVARRLGRRFGVRPAAEVTVSRTDRGEEAVVIVAFTCDHRRRWGYALHLLAVQLMTHAAVRLGGRPYGVGVWNAPFLHARLSRAERRALQGRKRELDPHGVLNPGKFFRVRGRRLGAPLALLLRPAPFAAGLLVARALSPLLGALARVLAPAAHDVRGWAVPAAAEERGRRVLRESAERCTFCGACVSTCPAYLLTGDERVTGRGKLRLAEQLARHEPVAADEAQRPFQCFVCGLCEEVCQVRLPLRDCYAGLEAWIEERQGRPRELIAAFAARADAERPRFLRAYGLDLPAWTPPPSSPPSPPTSSPPRPSPGTSPAPPTPETGA